MRLLLLGTSGYHPTATRHTACLVAPEAGLVLDAGTGMFRLAEHVVTASLDVFLTHAHLDHVGGLTYLLTILRGTPVREVVVHGLPHHLSSIREHLLAPAIFPVVPPLSWRPLGEPVALSSGALVTWFPVEHPGGAVGYRVDWQGHSLAYVTDTTAHAQASYLSAIRGVRLLVHECCFPDDMAATAALTGHSCPTAVANLALSAGVEKLALVHLSPEVDRLTAGDWNEVRRVFPHLQVGHDEQCLEW